MPFLSPENGPTPPIVDRRQWLQMGALGTAWWLATAGRAAGADDLPAPKYTLSCNIELMFPAKMSHVARLEMIASEGLKAYSFWAGSNKDLPAIAKAAARLGLSCGSIAGSGRTGQSTGLTKTGAEQAFLDDILENIEVAKTVGSQNLITFVGRKQPDIPWEKQHAQIIGGLRKAGDLAAKQDVYIVLEPLNRFEAPHMTVLTATEGFAIIEEVNHPHVKLDFDMYHLQLSEGNLINNLRRGLEKQWIRFVEVGDVPGRLEPGTGEVNYPNLFKVLRETGYDGYIGMEHRTSSTPQHAMQVVKRMAGV